VQPEPYRGPLFQAPQSASALPNVSRSATISLPFFGQRNTVTHLESTPLDSDATSEPRTQEITLNTAGAATAEVPLAVGRNRVCIRMSDDPVLAELLEVGQCVDIAYLP